MNRDKWVERVFFYCIGVIGAHIGHIQPWYVLLGFLLAVNVAWSWFVDKPRQEGTDGSLY